MNYYWSDYIYPMLKSSYKKSPYTRAATAIPPIASNPKPVIHNVNQNKPKPEVQQQAQAQVQQPQVPPGYQPSVVAEFAREKVGPQSNQAQMMDMFLPSKMNRPFLLNRPQ